MVLRKSDLYALSLLLVLILFSASNLVVSVESYYYFSVLRLASFLILLGIFIFFLLPEIKINATWPLFLYLLTSILVFSVFDGGDLALVNIRDLVLVFFASVVILLLLKSYSKRLDRVVVNFILGYFLIALVLIYVSGSFFFDFPPRFNFSFGSELIGREETYSLGVSNFFGLMAVILVYGFVSAYKYKWLLLVLSLLSLTLSMLGGARGEFLIALVLFVLIMFFVNFSLLKTILIMVFTSFVVIIVLHYINFEELLLGIEFFKRFETLQTGDLSSRDTLITQALNLIANKPLCLLTGCGPDFFQSYYNYPFELYPHNAILEYVISYGLISFLIVATLTVIGLSKFVNHMKFVSVPVLIFVYCFLVSLKSGYLLGSWLLLTFVFAFSAYFFAAKKVRQQHE